jgi:hypothetical protein
LSLLNVIVTDIGSSYWFFNERKLIFSVPLGYGPCSSIVNNVSPVVASFISYPNCGLSSSVSGYAITEDVDMIKINTDIINTIFLLIIFHLLFSL